MVFGRRKKKDKKGAEKEPMVRNVEENGHPPEKISDAELTILHGLKAEVEALKQQEAMYKRGLTLASADLIRKKEELTQRISETVNKYKLKENGCEFSFKTGEIRKLKKVETEK